MTAFIETMGAGNSSMVGKFFADILDYYRSSGELGGTQKLTADVEMVHTASPDLSASIRHSMSQDGTVSLIETLSGTHEGNLRVCNPHDRK